MSSFSPLPDERIRAARGASPVPQGITQGLDQVSLAVGPADTRGTQAIDSLLSVARQAAGLTATIGEDMRQREAYNLRLAQENERDVRSQQALQIRQQEDARRQAGIDADKLLRQQEIADRATFRNMLNVEAVKLDERLATNDAPTIDLLRGTADERLAAARDFVDATLANSGVPQDRFAAIDDERQAAIGRVYEAISRRRDQFLTVGEREEMAGAAQVMATSDATDFAVAEDAMLTGLTLHTRSQIIANTTIPAMEAIAESGNVERLRAVTQASAIGNDPAYAQTIKELTIKAESQRSRIATMEAANRKLGVYDAINSKNFVLARERAASLPADDRFEMESRIAARQNEQLREVDQQAKQSAIVNSIANLVPQALGEGLFIGDDLTVTYTGVDDNGQPAVKTTTVSRNDVREQVMQETMNTVVEQVKDLPLPEAFTRIFAVAARNNYVPPTVKEEMPSLRTRVSEGVASGQFAVPPNADRLLTQYRAMSPAYRETVLSANDRAFYERVNDLMQLPGATLEDSLRVAGRAENNPFPINYDSINTVVRSKIDGLASENTRSIYASWIQRRAGTYALRGSDADKAADKAIKDFEALSGEINGHRVLYAGQYAPINDRPFADVVNDYLQDVMIPRIMQENPTVLADPTSPQDREKLDPDTLIPVIDPQSGTLRLFEQSTMMPFFGDSRDTVRIEDIYRHAENAAKVKQAMQRQQVLGEYQQAMGLTPDGQPVSPARQRAITERMNQVARSLQINQRP